MRGTRFKLAFITGGSSGIGLAVAEKLVAAGTSVVLIARNEDRLASAKQGLQSRLAGQAEVRTLALDIADADSASVLLGQLMDEIGIPDLLVNNAGATYPAAFTDTPPEEYRHIIDVNLNGAWNALAAVVPKMKETGTGTIVNVSSLGGIIGTYGYSAYAASKFGLIGLSEVLRNELRPEGIDVHVLCPPDTDTPMLKQENQIKPAETSRISGNAGVMSAEAVASEMMKGLARGRFRIIPGLRSRLTALIHRLAPNLVFTMIDRDVRMVRREKSGDRSNGGA